MLAAGNLEISKTWFLPSESLWGSERDKHFIKQIEHQKCCGGSAPQVWLVSEVPGLVWREGEEVGVGVGRGGSHRFFQPSMGGISSSTCVEGSGVKLTIGSGNRYVQELRAVWEYV